MGKRERFFFIILVLALATIKATAQEIVIERKSEADSVRSTYIQPYDQYFNVNTFLVTKGLGFNMRPRSSDLPALDYAPNGSGFFGFGAFIFDLGISVAFKFPSSFQRSTAIYGKTDFFDFQGNVYGKQWNFDLAYQKYQGFYLGNPFVLAPVWRPTDALPVRRDLEISNALANVIYVFNPNKFSLRSSYNLSERQRISAGSFIFMTSINRFAIKSDSTLVPYQIRDRYPQGTNLQNGRFTSLSFMPGYSHNFVVKKFFFNVTIAAGAGLQNQKYTIDGRADRRVTIEPKYNIRGAAGYDNERFFTGSYFIYQQSRISVENLHLDANSGNFRVYVGYRFKKFGIFEKYSINDVLDRISSKIFPSKKD